LKNSKFKLEAKESLTFRKIFKCEPINPPVASWQDLHDVRSKVKKVADELLNNAEDEKRDLTEDERSGFDAGMELLDCINAEFDLRQEANTKEPLESRKFHRPDLIATEKKIIKPIGRTYRAMFYGDDTANLPGSDFRDLEEFLTLVASQRYDQRLEKRTFAETQGQTGGFTVPEEYSAEILDLSLEDEIVRPRATVYPMASATRNIPAWQQSDHTESVYGGWAGQWLAEDGTATVQTAKLRKVALHARKLAIYTDASREVLEDGLGLQQQLGPALVKAVSYYLDVAFLTGTGAGQPLGALNSPSAITVTRNTGSSVKYDDIEAMFGRLHSSCQKGAIWVANYMLIPQFTGMVVNNNLVFVPGMYQGISMPIPTSIFGKQIVFTEKTPALGSEGDLILADFSQYAVGMRKEVTIDKSNAPGWLEDLMSFRAILRADGLALWDKAVTPKNGTDTLSWCVVLQ
jgi:HK97 family phage major capsid protein